MAKVLVQIGSTKSKKQTQIVKAFINDQEVDWHEFEGRFLTTHKDRAFKHTVWFMAQLDLQSQDVLKIEVKTFLGGVGIDEERTFEALYYADAGAPVRNIDMYGVGLKGYPVLKGPILEIGKVSEEDKRKAEIEDFLNEGFNES